MSDLNKVTTPVARLVQGSLYEMSEDLNKNKKDDKGETVKNFYFAIAIPKGAETHWNQTAWGAKIYNFAVTEFPPATGASFVWKIEDGDSTSTNGDRRERSNSEIEGFPGNWIMRLKTFLPIGVYRLMPNVKDPMPWHDKGMVLPGDFIQVRISMQINKGAKGTPSIYLNPTMVCFNSYGPRIAIFVPEDVSDAGFGAAPVGSLTPLATIPATGTPAPAVAAPVTPPVTPVVPHTGILAAPPVAPPVAPPAKQMTAKANGASYEDFIKIGWTDATLIAQGYLNA